MRKLYSFRCSECGYPAEEFGDDIGIGNLHPHTTCTLCDGRLQRLVSFSYHPSMQPHFNNSTGTYVTGRHHFADELKRKSEEMSAQTGMDHNYVPVDLREKEALGVTDEGLEATERKQYDNNLTSRKIILP